MNTTLRALFAFATLALFQPAAEAQLFRTYLSLAGADTNPCTIAAPCRLLPAALGAVADGGEIWMLDSANYNAGTVNVTKSVSIVAVPGKIGSIVSVGGAAAMAVSAASARVTLRNIVVVDNAANHGLDGVTVAGGATLVVDSCAFANVQRAGLTVSGPSSAEVRDSVFRGTSYAIKAFTGSSVNVSRSDFFANDTALYADNNSSGSTTKITLSDSTVSGNDSSAIWAFTWVAGASAMIDISRSTIDHNLFGVETTGFAGNPTITVSSSTLVANSSNYYQGTPGTIYSMGNNLIADAPGGEVGTLTSMALQ